MIAPDPLAPMASYDDAYCEHKAPRDDCWHCQNEAGSTSVGARTVPNEPPDDELVTGLLDELTSRSRLKSATPSSEESTATRFVRGGDWILDAPPGIPAVWGRDDEVLWSEGEPVVLVGPAGVGKTTLAGQLVWGRLGLLDEVLGFPIKATASRVLYLAMDRPRQIQRAFARLATEAQRDELNKRLVVRQGPPPSDIAEHPEVLAYMANEAGADSVIIDSLKDAAIKLTDDAVGAGVNRAFQIAIADGKELLALHHQRKEQNGVKPKTLADVYGSTWITAGAGSVVLLWGQAGDAIVELSHLKQPGAVVGPLKVEHDHDRGRSVVLGNFHPLTFLRSRPNGATANEAARGRYETSEPTDNQVRVVRRQLDTLVPHLARKVDAVTGGPIGTQPARWYALDDRHGQGA